MRAPREQYVVQSTWNSEEEKTLALKTSIKTQDLFIPLQFVKSQNHQDKPARLIIRLLLGFASDSVFDKLDQSTNSETAMLSKIICLYIL